MWQRVWQKEVSFFVLIYIPGSVLIILHFKSNIIHNTVEEMKEMNKNDQNIDDSFHHILKASKSESYKSSQSPTVHLLPNVTSSSHLRSPVASSSDVSPVTIG